MSSGTALRVCASRGPSGSARSKETHAAILDAAAELLIEAGHGGFSIEEVARRSGAGKPTIYRWWQSRSSLFMEVYNRESAGMLLVADSGSTRDQLIEQIRALFSFWAGSACGSAFRALIAEAQGSPEALAQLRDQFLPLRRELARTVLNRAIARKEFAPGEAIEAALDMLYGFTFYRLLTDQLAVDDPAIEQIVDMVLTGLVRPYNEK